MTAAIRIGLIGDYQPACDIHQATEAAPRHAATRLGLPLELAWLPTASLDPVPDDVLGTYDALWCAPGSPYQSMSGALNAIRWAREHEVPCLGTCAGFQHMVIEYARNVLLISDAQHAEYGVTTGLLVITPLSCSLVGQTLEIRVDPEARVGHIYQQGQIQEQYYCTFGLDRAFQALLHDAGLRVVGVDQEGDARIIELPDHPFFVGTLFVPQRRSTMERPHPLIVAYVEAAARFHASQPRNDPPLSGQASRTSGMSGR
ncbi:MAG TPA: CTP synthase [Chloroflexota bacterium]|jgi:CTP synthase (UTP-ammonia lyase)